MEAQKLMTRATRRIFWTKKTSPADVWNDEALGRRLKMVGMEVLLLRNIAFEWACTLGFEGHHRSTHTASQPCQPDRPFTLSFLLDYCRLFQISQFCTYYFPKKAWFVKILFLPPTYQFFLTDISVRSVTFCNSVLVTIWVSEWRAVRVDMSVEQCVLRVRCHEPLGCSSIRFWIDPQPIVHS